MSGRLLHSPARIIRELLIDLSSGSATSDLTDDWGAWVNTLPDSPDEVITVNDTTGLLNGREMIAGEVLTMHGIQIIVRDNDQSEGYVKANEVAVAMDGVLRSSVTIDSSTYLVQAISRKGDTIYVGVDVPRSNLHLYSINATASICKTS
tara:strand:+ start:347 stop:796 length:450 start_codon:yes stop_codon:yes gene_type:complete